MKLGNSVKNITNVKLVDKRRFLKKKILKNLVNNKYLEILLAFNKSRTRRRIIWLNNLNYENR